MIGYQTRDYLQRMISSDVSRVDFYKGFIHDKGTNQVMEKVLAFLNLTTLMNIKHYRNGHLRLALMVISMVRKIYNLN
ncbi:UNVERIFIED_ORG: hypothetical protein [Escherichia phage CMSTMSU]